MSGSDGKSSNMPVSSRSIAGPSGIRTGLEIGGVPPGEAMSPGWGFVEDDSGAPSILEVENAPEGSM